MPITDAVLDSVVDQFRALIPTLEGEIKRLRGELVTALAELQEKREQLDAIATALHWTGPERRRVPREAPAPEPESLKETSASLKETSEPEPAVPEPAEPAPEAPPPAPRKPPEPTEAVDIAGMVLLPARECLGCQQPFRPLVKAKQRGRVVQRCPPCRLARQKAGANTWDKTRRHVDKPAPPTTLLEDYLARKAAADPPAAPPAGKGVERRCGRCLSKFIQQDAKDYFCTRCHEIRAATKQRHINLQAADEQLEKTEWNGRGPLVRQSPTESSPTGSSLGPGQFRGKGF